MEEFPLTEKQIYADNAYLCTSNFSSLCGVEERLHLESIS